MKAKISAMARVNYPPYGWAPIAGPRETWGDVTFSPEMMVWDKSTRLGLQVIDQGNNIAICAIDKIANLSESHPDWVTETKSDGRLGSRPNGIIVSYVIPKQDIIEHGLPGRSEIEAAFHRDAYNILKRAYTEQKWFPIYEPQPFSTEAQIHDHEWQQIEKDIQQGIYQNRSKIEPKAIPNEVDQGEIGRFGSVIRELRARIAGEKTPRRGMIIKVVALGATLTAASWALMRHRTTDGQEGKGGQGR